MKRMTLSSPPSGGEPQIQNSTYKIIDEIIIVTGDRDMLQLVDTAVKVYMPIQGLTVIKLYGEKKF